MLLSICIPIYNTDIRPLAVELKAQIASCTEPVELIFLDDASDKSYQLKNKEVSLFCQYIELPFNVGRSKIRNTFLQYAKGRFLLFLDGDSLICRSDFIEKYIGFILEKRPNLVVGGRLESIQKPSRKFQLRWKYSVLRESKPFEERVKRQIGFQSNNFIVETSLFEANLFDESLTSYGHEDTLFGYQLKEKGVVCKHIDNPVLNNDLVENSEFLRKTKDALANLLFISMQLNDEKFDDEQKLLKCLKLLTENKYRLVIFSAGGMFFRPLLGFVLKKGFFYLWMFDLYRLLELLELYFKIGKGGKPNLQTLN